MDTIENGRKVIQKETDALRTMVGLLDDNFKSVFDAIKNREGKVVFTGVGKSGHIGEKLAATFSSLGTPAIFVHSTEAAHGDLGMITKGDVVLLLSNSGETGEVLNVLPSLRIIGVTTVAFTSKPESTLARECDLLLPYSYDTEADPNNLAPTTSALLMISVGDALGVALSESMDFGKEDFHVFHPGGALGAKLENDHQ